MFTWWGTVVHRLRFAVIGIAVAGLLALGAYGFGLEDHLSSGGLFDPNSESSLAGQLADDAFGRDHSVDVAVLYTAPEGKTVDDPDFSRKIIDNLNSLPRDHPDQITGINAAYWRTETGKVSGAAAATKDKKHAIALIAIRGESDTEMVRNYRKVQNVFRIPGVDVRVSGLQPIAGSLNDTMAQDLRRMEAIALPAVGVLLFFIFGGVVAAALPLAIGGLTMLGAMGIMRIFTTFTEVNSFVSSVVTMIGLGLAIDYGLFIVSRFREEVAEGYATPAAVRRTVMTAGRTVVFSATMIIVSLGGMLLFPQGFLKSMAYGAITTVTLAALTAITILPAMLAVLGKRVDALGLKRFRRTKSAEEVENGFWGRFPVWVMKHPLKISISLCVVLLLLILPVQNLVFGGFSEKYLPPNDPVRLAKEQIDTLFPLRRSDPIQLIFVAEDTVAIGSVLKQANNAPGLKTQFEPPKRPDDPQARRDIHRTSASLVNLNDAGATVDYLRSIELPDGVTMLVGGIPVLQKDSIDALLIRIPLMVAVVLLLTTLLMFLTFGSLVLPIKAALMSALGLGSTLGILTWIFLDGHGAGLLNFTPQPIQANVLVLIIAIIYGLSTDYEVFLMSRMVEARAAGASTTEAVRIGTAHTGRIITAAALILLVVTGAFAFSKLVMMQYIAYGMIAALFIDATVLRMLLVPATMKLLGDDCWWAPRWMTKIQQKIGLGEPILAHEHPSGAVTDLVQTTPITDPVTEQITALEDNRPGKGHNTTQGSPQRPGPTGLPGFPAQPRAPRTIRDNNSEAPTRPIPR
ncbi:MMPL family transporter [Nocardia altamirensis]|uniref:MMPL family transporter n=1 Tax=Nocardia altamirensis TaxID=472158 RepID=UPI0009FCAAA2|nr:MMPL family transporter [Nocardia altamirensis]